MKNCDKWPMFEERSWGEYQVFDMVSAEEEQKV